MITAAGREPAQRTTTYGEVPTERVVAARNAPELAAIVNTPARKYERRERRPLVRSATTHAEAG